MARAVESSDSELRQLPAPFFTDPRGTVWHWWSTQNPHGPWDIVGLYVNDSGAGSYSLLGAPENFNRLLLAAQADLSTPERAGQAAALFDETTRPPVAHHQRIGSVDEVPWNRTMTDGARRRADEVTTRYRNQIAPLSVTGTAGAYEATYWTVTQQTLVRHRLQIADRRIESAPTLMEAGLPTPIAL